MLKFLKKFFIDATPEEIELYQGDKITLELDGEEFTIEAWSDLEISSNSLIVINNTLCRTGDVTKVSKNHYKVSCFYQDALIAQDGYYFGKQSELD